MSQTLVRTMVLAAALVGAPDGIAASVSPPPSGALIKVVEYYHAGLDHYFMTANEYEQQQLDSGKTRGWVRTGAWFDADMPNAVTSSASPVCRFYGRPDAGLDSHFYSASPDECAAVAKKFAASWLYESGNVFRVNAADPVTGACPDGTVPVYRIFNNRRDANHRYTMDRAVRDQMVAAGHLPEGYGRDSVAFCAKGPLPTVPSAPEVPSQTPPPSSPPEVPSQPPPPSAPPTERPPTTEPPPAPISDLQAARLLQQATFGPTVAEIARVKALGVTAWVDDQLNKPKTSYPVVPWFPASRPQPPSGQDWPYCQYSQYTTASYSALAPCNCANQPGTTNQCSRDVYSVFQLQRRFFVNALYAPDQLRHRVAWALSQIIVTSAAQDPIAYANRDYQQLMVDNAFGNFGDLLTKVTLNPFMGNYLDTVNNRKGAGARQPNENFAREILQLFSIGLWELRDDGTMLLDALGEPIATYDQADVTELARVYTGWVYPPLPGQTPRLNATVTYHAPMAALEIEHDTASKRVLDLTTLPAGGTALADVTAANNAIFRHPNVGPFIAKQLIQQLVTSNPSPRFVADIAAVFNNNGAGARGDLRAVVRAILLHGEARADRDSGSSAFGKLKEPVLLITSALRALGATSDGVDPIQRARSMGQNVFTAESVFNYYPADYAIPGTGLMGPPFGIFDATNYFARTNWVYNQLTLGASCTGNVCGPALDTTVVDALGTRVDYTPLADIAGDAAALVDRVNVILLHNTMTAAMRQQIINAVSAYPSASATDRLNRARTAVYLAVSSPRFQTEF